MLQLKPIRAVQQPRREVSLQKTYEPWTPEYISVGFIAKHCGVSNTTVLRWINARQLTAFKLPGGHFRIERNDLSEFLVRHNMPVRNNHPEEIATIIAVQVNPANQKK
jgi:excisionase family DNA binding protein